MTIALHFTLVTVIITTMLWNRRRTKRLELWLNALRRSPIHEPAKWEL